MTSRWSIRAGRVVGIEIRLHASMLLLVWLVGAYAAEDPRGLAGATLWVATIFFCVLVHEFAHSLVARRLGIRVREIELLPIGGVSKMDVIPDNPRQELAIALAGPAASIAIGVSFLAVTAAIDGRLAPFDVAGGPLPNRVGWFNLVIGVFNLLPALPLDGGRVLRAAFEPREGALGATHHAARIARVVAWGLIAVGAFGNVFLMFIGLFVLVVSRTEEFTADVHHALEPLRVSDLMVQGALTVPADETLRSVRDCLRHTSQRQFPVLDAGGGYCGILDIRRAAGTAGDTLVAAVTESVPPVSPEARVTEVDWTRQPVLAAVDDAGNVVGLLRSEDVLLAAQATVAASPPA